MMNKDTFKIAFLSLDQNMNPHIGFVSMASYLEKKLGLKNIRIIEANFENITEETIKYQPNIVCISAFTIDYGETEEVIKQIKQKINCTVIIGGPHISTFPNSLSKVFDFGVFNEGELTLTEYITKLLEKGGSLTLEEQKTIKGICFHNKEKIIITAPRELAENLDEFLPLNKKFFHPTYFKNKRIVSMHDKQGTAINFITSRGCPYKCTFCSTTVFWNKIRFNSVEKVADEIQEYYEKYGVKHFDVVDDLFCINKNRLRNLTAELEKRNLLGKITMMCQLRANMVDDELCQILKDLGVKSVGFGFESGSEKIIRVLKGDNVSVEDNRSAVCLCKKYGFIVSGSIIFGSPGETVEDFNDTLKFIDFCISKKVDSLAAYILTPFPGTKIWEIAKQQGKVSDNMDWALLSHANLKEPIYLNKEMDYETFKKMFLVARKKLQYYKWVAIKNNIKNAPLELFKSIIKNPANAVKILFGHKMHS